MHRNQIVGVASISLLLGVCAMLQHLAVSMQAPALQPVKAVLHSIPFARDFGAVGGWMFLAASLVGVAFTALWALPRLAEVDHTFCFAGDAL